MERDAERRRLDETSERGVPWKRWGPYLSERQWGTVREDYSPDGNAWSHFTHDQARSRAYRWGEDGIAGISDDSCVLCFAVALWNGRDPILKERLFGLANAEGNHGEDVKELYFYLDSTPTHSYMKLLYKYPQEPFPYDDLVRTNRERGKKEPEYELLDTGIFDEDRYFDVLVEYAKAGPEDILIRITVENAGPVPAEIHVLPHFWFRNTWSWMSGGARPRLTGGAARGARTVHAHHEDPSFRESVDGFVLYSEGDAPILFTENESNHARLFNGTNATPFVKDGIDDCVVHGRTDAVNPAGVGTKAAVHHRMTIAGGASRSVRLRLTRTPPRGKSGPFAGFDEVFRERKTEAETFHRAILPAGIEPRSDRANVMRQALAGVLWGKQFFHYDLALWLEEHGAGRSVPPEQRPRVRNGDWAHMLNRDVISMPDKWEYPWYAAWDLAFHTIPIAMADPAFAKSQLLLMLDHRYQHPNGQLPAYEWNFGDVNPPVHAAAAMQVYLIDQAMNGGKGDLGFLKKVFSKLLLNFTWWVNLKDQDGNNCFDGGFLGLDNIGVFDRSAALPTGGRLEQADGTSWMVFFSQNMFRIAVELALHDPAYEDFATKFFAHTVEISAAMDRLGDRAEELWDDADGFYYDVLRMPDGSARRLQVRSMVGLLPLAAVAVFEADRLAKLSRFQRDAQEIIGRNPGLSSRIHLPQTPGIEDRRMLSILDETKLRRILHRMLDENEFLGPHGIRALSRHHREHPFVLHAGGREHRVDYAPGDSPTSAFGGNSNWRGPVWMPVNFLVYLALHRLYAYYGDRFTVECPTGSGRQMNLFQVAHELAARLTGIFLRGKEGARPVHGRSPRFQTDPRWKDLILFYEYFHGDDGHGLGASHQTGWTALIARILQYDAVVTPAELLAKGAEGRVMARMHGPAGRGRRSR
jgi:hypothetical protein